MESAGTGVSPGRRCSRQCAVLHLLPLRAARGPAPACSAGSPVERQQQFYKVHPLDPLLLIATQPSSSTALPHWSRVPERGYFGTGASSVAGAEHTRDRKEDKAPSDSETFGTCLLSRMLTDISGNAWILSNDTGKPPPHLRRWFDMAPFECVYQMHSSCTRPLGEETRVTK